MRFLGSRERFLGARKYILVTRSNILGEFSRFQEASPGCQVAKDSSDSIQAKT